MNHISTNATIRAMDKYIEDFGQLKAYISDNSYQFISKKWRDHWIKKNVELRYTLVYQLATNNK